MYGAGPGKANRSATSRAGLSCPTFVPPLGRTTPSHPCHGGTCLRTSRVSQEYAGSIHFHYLLSDALEVGTVQHRSTVTITLTITRLSLAAAGVGFVGVSMDVEYRRGRTP
ncbi:hypothetical protein J6590_068094 [Homalodisca vitripennis]|nr:hypothetical protein J6590_068094 [Homalodisca vitripennis]